MLFINSELKDQIITSCQELIRRPSLSGNEKEVAQYIAKTMERLGFDNVESDKFGNIIGTIILGKGGSSILFDGHMDHVDVSDPSKWKYDPYGGKIENNRIYGRGATDMKGNIAAMMHAASYIKNNLRNHIDGIIYIACVVHEECFEGVASQEVAKNYKPDFVVIGEPSGLTLKRGQRGRAELVLETYGKTAHSSNPEIGLNAIKKMAALIVEIEKSFIPKKHDFLGKGILEITDIISSPYPGASVVPDLCRATYDRRLLPNEAEEEILDQIENIINMLHVKDPSLTAKVYLSEGSARCYTGATIKAKRFAPAWIYDEHHTFVQAAHTGLLSVGQKPTISHYAFCTNGSYYAGKAKIPTVGYGGSHEHLAHVTDEYIEIEHLLLACEGYIGITRSFFKKIAKNK
ncbi:peptidase [Acetomicrobium hydrogeniformans ATCC BAA-1850]|uniref:Peptidase n=1 Tax=Acetomicrobium hydrogeniformans ATCC BAA-1850 TaxID=592015 RepID=A0A0T5XA15_9BACT|nr:peptidase [Acetomicrobium hydrogeniformans ATCC BAA-1850]